MSTPRFRQHVQGRAQPDSRETIEGPPLPAFRQYAHRDVPVAEAKTDKYDCPRKLNTGDRVEIHLKEPWLDKLLLRNGNRFVRGEGADKKAVKRIFAILTKEKVKAASPSKAYMPENDNEFLVEDISEGTLDIYLEDETNSGNFEFKFRASIPLEYVQWRQLSDLPASASDEEVRFKAALDCLHTFGGAGEPFHDDITNLRLLSARARRLARAFLKAQNALDEWRTKQAFGAVPENLREDLDKALAAASWDKNPPLEFDRDFQELSVEELSSLDDAAREHYTDDDHIRRQLIIRDWAVGVAMEQMQKAQRFEIKFADDSEWYLAHVIRNDRVQQIINFALVDKQPDGTQWTGNLLFAEDTFRLLNDGEDETIDEASYMKKEADQAARDQEDEETDDEDDDPLMNDDVRVGYMDEDGNEISGTITNKRPRTDNASPSVRIEFPYEYEIDGVWIRAERVYQIEDAEYKSGQRVICPDGVEREINEVVGHTALFSDYGGDDGVTFDELDDAAAVANDEKAAAAIQTVEQSDKDGIDVSTPQNWRGRLVRLIEPLSKATIKEPPYNVPYLEYTDKEWEKIRVNKDDLQSEIVDLQDISTGEVFRKVSASELNETGLHLASDAEVSDAEESTVSTDASEDSSDSSDSDEEEDNLLTEVVEYTDPDGSLIVGTISDRRLRTDDADPSVRIEFPYEYEINGVWVGGERVHNQTEINSDVADSLPESSEEDSEAED